MNASLMAKSIMAFDHSYEPEIELYNNLPYSRDLSVCPWDSAPQMVSGNIVKFFQYNIGKPQIIQADDEEYEIPEYRRLSTVVDSDIPNDIDDFSPLDAFAEGEALVSDDAAMAAQSVAPSPHEEELLDDASDSVLPMDEFVDIQAPNDDLSTLPIEDGNPDSEDVTDDLSE